VSEELQAGFFSAKNCKIAGPNSLLAGYRILPNIRGKAKRPAHFPATSYVGPCFQMVYDGSAVAAVYMLLAIYITECNGQGNRLYIREGSRRDGGSILRLLKSVKVCGRH
jgi:hypothetical protein